MDNENHSDFDPLNAPNWVLQVFAKENNHLLSQHISKFMLMCQSSTIIDELIGDLLKRRNFNGWYWIERKCIKICDIYREKQDYCSGNYINWLTTYCLVSISELNVPSHLSISRIIAGGSAGGGSSNMNEIKGSKRFLPEETLVSMLYYLFPDADQNNVRYMLVFVF